jgi:hypothetical protein
VPVEDCSIRHLILIPFFPAVEATRPIQRGEKLTVDYGKAFKRAWLKNSGDADSGSGTDGEDGWIGGRDEAQAADLSGIIASASRSPRPVLLSSPSTYSKRRPAAGPILCVGGWGAGALTYFGGVRGARRAAP